MDKYHNYDIFTASYIDNLLTTQFYPLTRPLNPFTNPHVPPYPQTFTSFAQELYSPLYNPCLWQQFLNVCPPLLANRVPAWLSRGTTINQSGLELQRVSTSPLVTKNDRNLATRGEVTKSETGLAVSREDDSGYSGINTKEHWEHNRCRASVIRRVLPTSVMDTIPREAILTVESLSYPYSPHNISISDPHSPHTVSLSDPHSPHTVSRSDPHSPHTVSLSDPHSPHTVSLSDPHSPHTVSLSDRRSPHNISLSDPHSPHISLPIPDEFQKSAILSRMEIDISDHHTHIHELQKSPNVSLGSPDESQKSPPIPNEPPMSPTFPLTSLPVETKTMLNTNSTAIEHILNVESITESHSYQTSADLQSIPDESRKSPKVYVPARENVLNVECVTESRGCQSPPLQSAPDEDRHSPKLSTTTLQNRAVPAKLSRDETRAVQNQTRTKKTDSGRNTETTKTVSESQTKHTCETICEAVVTPERILARKTVNMEENNSQNDQQASTGQQAKEMEVILVDNGEDKNIIITTVDNEQIAVEEMVAQKVDTDKSKARRDIIKNPKQQEVNKIKPKYSCLYCKKQRERFCQCKANNERLSKHNLCPRSLKRNESYQLCQKDAKAKQTLHCSSCLTKFVKKQCFEKHVCERRKVKPFLCGYCKVMINETDNILSHLAKLHKEKKCFTCQYCEADFMNARKMVKHIRGHTGEKPFKCRTCQKSFLKKSALQIHQRVHSGIKPYTCTQCSKTFSIKGNLLRHHVIHTGERPYKCGQCEKSYNNPSHLARHKANQHCR